MRSGKEHVSHSHQKYRKALVGALDGAIRAAAPPHIHLPWKSPVLCHQQGYLNFSEPIFIFSLAYLLG